MLAITVLTEDGHRHVRASAGKLAELVNRLGGQNDRFLVIQRIPDLPEVFIQVWHEDEGDYELEHRDGASDRHFQAVVDRPESVIAAMTRWARLEDEWGSGLNWTPLDLGLPEPPPSLELDEDERKELDARIREVIVGGYATRAQLAEIAQDYLVSGDRRPVSPEQARRLVDRMWLERVDAQRDPLRIDAQTVRVIAEGVLVRTRPSPLTPSQRGRLHGARLAQSPNAAVGRFPKVQRVVAGNGTLMVAGCKVQVGQVHRGKVVTVALEETRFRVLFEGEELSERPRTVIKEVNRLRASGHIDYRI
ncbi:hypothetical protein [Streptosporangium vulgare]|uniref:Uncharacterized protein n=1 Tax=Streptosporangium vulgare TaxID=46190 RepID=A0ABV5T705_9ACTN